MAFSFDLFEHNWCIFDVVVNASAYFLINKNSDHSFCMLIRIKNLIGIVLNPVGRVDAGLLILRVFTGYLMFTYHGLSKITAGPERWESLGLSLIHI